MVPFKSIIKMNILIFMMTRVEDQIILPQILKFLNYPTVLQQMTSLKKWMEKPCHVHPLLLISLFVLPILYITTLKNNNKPSSSSSSSSSTYPYNFINDNAASGSLFPPPKKHQLCSHHGSNSNSYHLASTTVGVLQELNISHHVAITVKLCNLFSN